MWSDPIPYQIPSLFFYDEEAGSPIVDPPDVGIAINAINVGYDGEVLQFRLLVTYTLAEDYVRAFARIFWAMVVCIENADTGQCEAFNLSELGRITYPDVPVVNFNGDLAASDVPTSFKTGWVGLDLEIDVPQPAFHPSLFLTVKLHNDVSNTLGIDLENVLPITFKGGEPVVLECADLSDQE
jgi:hypothetical protein